jgi:hypothetical protein
MNVLDNVQEDARISLFASKQLTHFPDGRIVTPRKIAAANAAARSFLPPLAALTA